MLGLISFIMSFHLCGKLSRCACKLALLSGIVINIAGCSPENNNAINVSGIECLEPEWDFGNITPDINRVEHEFELVNTSDTPVKVIDIKTSCGCVLVESKPSVIPAKKSIKIDVQLKTAGRVGPLRQSVSVLIQGSKHDELISLSLKGSVSPPAGLNTIPNKINFGRLAPGETAIRRVTIESVDESPVEIASVVKSLENLDCVVEPGPNRSRVNLVATFTAQESGIVFSKIDIYRKNHKQTPIVIRFQADVRSPRYGVVERIFIPQVEHGHPYEVNLQVDHVGEAHQVDEVTYEGDDSIVCSIFKPDKQIVEITCAKGAKKVVRGKLRVKLTNEAVIEVPLILIIE